jgi:peptidoglycan hydrolase-like protein with peptidoglycan-binding domain
MGMFTHKSPLFGSLDLTKLDDVQDALSKLGFDPGQVDGRNGPKTQAAVRQFQTACMIPADGIVGPQTRGALKAALENAASKVLPNA